MGKDGSGSNRGRRPGFESEPCSTLGGVGIPASEKIGKSCNPDKEHHVHKYDHDRAGCRSEHKNPPSLTGGRYSGDGSLNRTRTMFNITHIIKT